MQHNHSPRKFEDMKTKLLIFAFFTTFSFYTFGQNNPIQNLTFTQSYENMHNLFELSWDEPIQPHNELVGYNIYRDNELYRFQTEKTLYYLYTPLYGYVTNDTGVFLLYVNGSGFEIHVTAVYNPVQIESNYLQTVYSSGAALTTNNFIQGKSVIFPNPTDGMLNIENENLEKIVLYDISGKIISEFAPVSQIDLSTLTKGVYIIKLYSEKEITTNKLVIQ